MDLFEASLRVKSTGGPDAGPRPVRDAGALARNRRKAADGDRSRTLARNRNNPIHVRAGLRLDYTLRPYA